MSYYSNLFGFYGMVGNYDQRNVGNDTTKNSFEIDTSEVTDRDRPYEAAVKHPEFNNGEWIILGWAPDKESARSMHQAFVERFEKEGDSIEELVDAYTEVVFKRKRI